MLTRRDFLLTSVGVGAGLFAFGPGNWLSASPLELDVFKGYPRAFFFRPSEQGLSGELLYEEWESRYLPLGGILGKVLNEAHDYTGKNNLEWFVRYKNRNPQKMVLLHYNGTGRRATDESTTRFFAGHFLYYQGTNLTKRLEASPSATVLHVADTSVFKLKRSMGIPDDIAITRVGSDGKPNWETAEHVRLETIDRRNNTITVSRGLYGTPVRRFRRGSYVAAHVTTGPYGYEDTPQQEVPLWSYNFSTLCPRDMEARNCGDALVDYLGEKLGPTGELAAFDGIVFDVLSFVVRFARPVLDVDVDTDGEADSGIVDGVNVVGMGVNQFLTAIRERLPDKILLSDGHVPRASQRGFGHLNGMESEGYPDKYDIRLDHLSKGENIFEFWKENSASPSLNYVSFRYMERKTERPRNTFREPNLSEDRSYEKLRLALASALFSDSAFAYGGVWIPPDVTWKSGPEGARVRVLDELWKGTEQVPNWLGQPLGPAVHLAQKAQDLFEEEGVKQGVEWSDAFVGRFQGEGVAFSREGSEQAPVMAIRSTAPASSLPFELPGIDVTGEDLFVSLRLRAEPLEGYPTSVPRRVDVSAVPAGGEPFSEFTWAGEKPFSASLYFHDVGPGTVDLRFEVEGGQPVFLERLTAHSAADGRYREYEGGVVFANPSTRDYTFDVGALFKDHLDSGVTLQLIQGSSGQDAATNNGSVVGKQLTLPAKDGLFVVKVKPSGG